MTFKHDNVLYKYFWLCVSRQSCLWTPLHVDTFYTMFMNAYMINCISCSTVIVLVLIPPLSMMMCVCVCVELPQSAPSVADRHAALRASPLLPQPQDPRTQRTHPRGRWTFITCTHTHTCTCTCMQIQKYTHKCLKEHTSGGEARNLCV